MARMVLVALAWCAVRGDDYVGGAMPQYGAADPDYDLPGARGAALADDYRGHSPDAPAPLDYKYEEAHGDTEKPSKYMDEADNWRRPDRKQRPPREDIKEDLEHDVDQGSDETPKLKTSRRHSRRKERSRRKNSRDADPNRRHEPASGRVKHHENELGLGRGKLDDSGPDYSESNDYPDKRNKYQEHEDPVQVKSTTARVIRRKPRDRMYVPPPAEASISSDDDDQVKEPREEYDEGGDRLVGRSQSGDSEPEVGGGRSDVDFKPRIKPKYRNYPEYGDYYDMKRVKNMKNKLPTMLQRTSALPPPLRTPSELVEALWPERRPGAGAPTRIPEYSSPVEDTTRLPTPAVDVEYPMSRSGANVEYPMRRPSPDIDDPPRRTAPDIEYPPRRTAPDIEYPMRRAGADAVYSMQRTGSDAKYALHRTGSDAEYPLHRTGSDAEYPLHRTGSDAEYPLHRTGSDVEYPMRRAGAGVKISTHPPPPIYSGLPTIYTGPPSVTSSTEPTTQHELTMTTEPATPTTTPTPVIHTTKNATKLSLAEKSRLSIMKKAQMKENIKSESTKKPPVLLQVRNKAPTVVMVEPATTENPWMRAREVGDDSPETLEKVKRLMRTKLVGSAKNIRDLTDDWDQLVCDYIDVGLLDQLSSDPPPARLLHSLLIGSVMLIIML